MVVGGEEVTRVMVSERTITAKNVVQEIYALVIVHSSQEDLDGPVSILDWIQSPFLLATTDLRCDQFLVDRRRA